MSAPARGACPIPSSCPASQLELKLMDASLACLWACGAAPKSLVRKSWRMTSNAARPSSFHLFPWYSMHSSCLTLSTQPHDTLDAQDDSAIHHEQRTPLRSLQPSCLPRHRSSSPCRKCSATCGHRGRHARVKRPQDFLRFAQEPVFRASRTTTASPSRTARVREADQRKAK